MNNSKSQLKGNYSIEINKNIIQNMYIYLSWYNLILFGVFNT